ncbi:hypothetical protein [Chryseobacterium sp. G0201]|uniref:hypothetical protein n=1 Tax=Chryseobacterium sp. G0201 TaxID=2487065 RepID=UPI0013DE1F8E|nr:hypothetical protein [Chryseobacterium sp. G0201]
MEKRAIAYPEDSRGGLDNDYTLYDDGTIEHKYDVAHNIGARGYNKSLSLKVVDLNEDVKQLRCYIVHPTFYVRFFMSYIFQNMYLELLRYICFLHASIQQKSNRVFLY